ncbi:MAG: starch-binding protein [Muribaculaceae bacterium]|nr:starch-binding protein [Muribaculaceae bacterium]
MKKITTLLIALFCVAIAANATVTINVRTTTGDAPFLYAWNGAGTALNGAWPGTQMDEAQTYVTVDGLVWLTQTFEEDAINIIFNDGGLDEEGTGAIQTDNIMGVTETAFYVFDPEEGEFTDVTSTYITPTGFDINTLPSTVVYVAGKEFAYFIAPKTWTKCNVWAWNSATGTNFTTSGTWPGDPITLIGNTTDGNPVYQWIGPDIVDGDSPTGIIFNNGTTQTSDLAYVAGGVYNLAGKLLYTVPGGGGNIELLEPVITDNYIEFVGVKASGNYKFTLNTYEWEEDHGPQFQLTIEPIDPSKPASFAAEDINDPNYWEPMFMRVTQEMAGQSMTAQDNIKRLYLGDVQLLENQFIDYNELHVVGFNLNNDYTLPEGCLLNAGQHMDEMDVKCNGTMTLSPNSLPADKNFVVTVYTQQMYDVWNAYKQTYNCQYILNLQSAVYGDVNGDGTVTASDITELYNYLLDGDMTYFDTADVNGDGDITAADITAVYDILLGN